MSHADALFAIGKTHTVCEDYARAGLVHPEEDEVRSHRPYAIVSDGCSSSEDTDFGSRLLTASAVHSLNMFDTLKAEWAIWRALDRVMKPLHPNCLDATLLTAHEDKSGVVQVFVAGDGVVVAKPRKGGLLVWVIDYQGAPGYLTYLMDRTRFDLWINEGLGKRTVTTLNEKGEVVETEEHQFKVQDDEEGIRNFGWTIDFDPRDFELVMLLSDGAQSFVDDKLNLVPLTDVIPHLLDIRMPKGKFLARSHRFFLAKTCPKLGWQNNDDFGSAAIMLDNPEE